MALNFVVMILSGCFGSIVRSLNVNYYCPPEIKVCSQFF